MNREAHAIHAQYTTFGYRGELQKNTFGRFPFMKKE